MANLLERKIILQFRDLKEKYNQMQLILILFFFAFFFTSCKQNKAEFSCDPALNEYVSTHQNRLKSISISSLISSDLFFQQAVFRSFDAVKKRDVWLQKIQLLLETQNYSQDEYEHVKSLLDHLHENYFVKENIDSEANERKQFASDWINKAKNSLGWSDRQVAFVVYRLYTDPAQFDAESIVAQSKKQATSGESTENCFCNTSADFCANSLCHSGNCVLDTGCGWIWSGSCDGLCFL